jgi:LAS superfamily LD-carboxypeptidase LdcB
VEAADEAWMALVVAAQLDGVDLEGGWCYRTYQEQLEAWTRRQCYVAGNCDGDPYPPTATPGTSLHGWGLAVDVWGASRLLLSCSSSEFLWMQLNAPRFGWVHPEWASCGRVGAEPWHWEYVGSEFVITAVGE